MSQEKAEVAEPIRVDRQELESSSVRNGSQQQVFQ